MTKLTLIVRLGALAPRIVAIQQQRHFLIDQCKGLEAKKAQYLVKHADLIERYESTAKIAFLEQSIHAKNAAKKCDKSAIRLQKRQESITSIIDHYKKIQKKVSMHGHSAALELAVRQFECRIELMQKTIF